METTSTETATEIERQANALDLQISLVNSSCDQISNSLTEAASIVSSEDSNLSSVMKRYADVFVNIKTLLVQKYTELSNVMHSYSTNTITNETDTGEKINNYNSQLSDISSFLSGLK